MAGAEVVLTVADVIQRVVKKIDEIRSLPKECQRLSNIISLLQPIYIDLKEQLRDSRHRKIVEMLLKGLTNAEEVVDYIRAHPNYSAFRSGKYKKKLEDAVKDIDDWIGRIEPLTSGETIKKVEAIKAGLNNYLRDIQATQAEILENLDHLPESIVRQIRDELVPLVHPTINSTGKAPTQWYEVQDEQDKILF